ncbi:MAG: YbjN domain-containing protein [Salinarimonadaceae bacterium]|nr:MAG: YbjN domain-containing protein [Salinarimonadaceae bacterium]
MAFAVMASVAPAASASELIDASDPAEILNIARGFGSANLDKDGDGDPLIVGRIDGYRYAVYFYGCVNGERCTSIAFYSVWILESFDSNRINEWNRDRRYARSYIDRDGDPAIQMDVNLDFGVSRLNFDDTFALWSSVLKEFASFVDP